MTFLNMVYQRCSTQIKDINWTLNLLSQLLAVQKTQTSPYDPQYDGMIERFNKTLID